MEIVQNGTDSERHVAFQMVEVALSKTIFSEILFRIERLQYCSALQEACGMNRARGVSFLKY